MQFQQFLADLAGDLNGLHVGLLLVAGYRNKELLILVIEGPLEALSLLGHQIDVFRNSVFDSIASLGFLLIADESEAESCVFYGRYFDFAVPHE